MSSGQAADQRAALIADALSGLAAPRKALPCKWLYDAEGTRLFERITSLPEYYPTRTEQGIFAVQGAAMAARIGAGAAVVELGPGDGAKAVQLLRLLRDPAAYVPVEIAADWLRAAAARVAAACPGLPVWPVVADFTREFALPPTLGAAPRLGFFPGSTIGNFTPVAATGFLRRLRATLGDGSRLLLGADLVKDPARLIAAYDDAAGVTAAFNLNLLARLNREAGADFDLAGFRHRAVWNAARDCVEMHLVSLRDQRVTISGRVIAFREGETIHTEDSHKYRLETFPRLAADGGWREEAAWTDPERLFSVWLLAAA